MILNLRERHENRYCAAAALFPGAQAFRRPFVIAAELSVGSADTIFVVVPFESTHNEVRSPDLLEVVNECAVHNSTA
jgi:hypothetical protein